MGETSEAMGVRTERETRWRAGALMANTDGLFGASAGEITSHEPRFDHTVRLRCHVNSEELYPRPVYLASSERIINIVH